MAVATIDLPLLAPFLSVPESSLSELVNSPTTELLSTVLGTVSARARELEEIRSDKLKLEIELENAVRGGESKASHYKTTLERSQSDVAKLRQQLQVEGQRGPIDRLSPG